MSLSVPIDPIDSNDPNIPIAHNAHNVPNAPIDPIDPITPTDPIKSRPVMGSDPKWPPTPQGMAKNGGDAEIDEGLYSRQL